MTAEAVATGAIELAAPCTGSTVVLRVCVVVGGESGRWATELHDGVGYTHAFAEGWNANLGLEQVDIEFKEDVAGDFLLYVVQNP